jgi:hypothetical protein
MQLLRSFGVVSVLLTWVSISYILYVNERNLERSVSHHAAIKARSHMIFGVFMTASLIFMFLFMYGWFIPYFQLPATFSIIVGAALILELATTWVPLTTGWKYIFHQTSSYGAAMLIPFLLFITLFSPKMSNIAAYVNIASLAIMVFLLYLFVFVKSARLRYLIYQNVYVAAFHVAILATAYIL